MRVTERQLRRIIVEAIKSAESMNTEELFLQLVENLRLVTEYYDHYNSLSDDNNSIENHSHDLADRALEAMDFIRKALNSDPVRPYIGMDARGRLGQDASDLHDDIYSMAIVSDQYKTLAGTHDDSERGVFFKDKNQEDPKKAAEFARDIRRRSSYGKEKLEKFKEDLAMAVDYERLFHVSKDPRLLDFWSDYIDARSTRRPGMYWREMS
jgi:hypothetical protein